MEKRIFVVVECSSSDVGKILNLLGKSLGRGMVSVVEDRKNPRVLSK